LAIFGGGALAISMGFCAFTLTWLPWAFHENLSLSTAASLSWLPNYYLVNGRHGNFIRAVHTVITLPTKKRNSLSSMALSVSTEIP
jgi:hypothetical protein